MACNEETRVSLAIVRAIVARMRRVQAPQGHELGAAAMDSEPVRAPDLQAYRRP